MVRLFPFGKFQVAPLAFVVHKAPERQRFPPLEGALVPFL